MHTGVLRRPADVLDRRAGPPRGYRRARAHTTYLPYARTIYEEGLQFPCIRFQENYEDKADLIRLCRMQIRVSDVWYGDYRAQVGACRTAERRLKELVEKYGCETIAWFIDAWIAYGERRMIATIRDLPAGSWRYETRHDPVPTVADEGVFARARASKARCR